MRLSLKTKQVAAVTLLVGLAVALSSARYLLGIAHSDLEESANRGDFLAMTIYQQAGRVATQPDLASALRADPGLRATLEAAIAYAPNVTYAAIVDRDDLAIAHSTPKLEGQRIPDQSAIHELLNQSLWEQVSAIYSERTFEVREPVLTASGEEFGTIRIGISMLLIREELRRALRPAIATTAIAVAFALLLATVFANWILRPIAVVQTGLERLGRGEVDVKLDLPSDDVFGELGQSFETVSAKLAEARTQLAGQISHLESAVDRLDDAVAVFSGGGDLLFANPAMRAAFAAINGRAPSDGRLPAQHPFRPLLERALTERRTVGPETVQLPPEGDAAAEHAVTAHALWGRDGAFVGIMIAARNIAYRTEVQSTLRYSKKLASLNRLLAGVAHEVKNPLNAMTIHLELLKQKMARQGATAVAAARAAAPPADVVAADNVLKHVTIIGQEIRRLDEVVQGFLKFSRPEDLDLKPVALRPLVDDVFSLVAAEASGRVELRNECPNDLPAVQGDPPLLRQALLNLSLNGCQAMPDGGILSIRGRPGRDGFVELEVADTGVGIPPENLERVFNLYFTTREGGSGLGLAMVYRTVQLHDGTIEVESTVGQGTTFHLRLPVA